MASMTDRELLQLAQAAVPEHLRSLGRIAVRHDAPAVAGLAAVEPAGDATMTALAKRVGAKLGAEEHVKAIIIDGRDTKNFGALLNGKEFKGTIIG